MDSRSFRKLCANVDGLSLGRLRELRRKRRVFDARREVPAPVDARGQALEACIPVAQRHGCAGARRAPGLQRLREPGPAGAASRRRPARRSRAAACPESCVGR